MTNPASSWPSRRQRRAVTNVSSLGFDLAGLIKKKKLAIDYVYIERSEIEETGEYDLEGLFVRLGYAIDSIGQNVSFSIPWKSSSAVLPNEGIVRAELRRLFRWLKKKGVTAIVTGERGVNTLTRYGLEEYVADCVILLDHRVTDQISTRRLRVVKYRGSVPRQERVPLSHRQRRHLHTPHHLPGPHLRMRPRKGSPRASPASMRCSTARAITRGQASLSPAPQGQGNPPLRPISSESACKRGERALYLAFEESPKQIIRNMRSAGIDLEPT